jgi:ubiquinone/menaquinone biosynthesis C-methylase UbiE
MTTMTPPQETWTDAGYVVESSYVRQYLKYQSPLTMAYAAAANGYKVPDVTKPFTYCDLGCGEGITLVVLAASFPQAQFYGIDMNTEHVERARALAADGGVTNVEFFEADFIGAVDLPLPKMDFVAAHGVITWVSKDILDTLYKCVDALLSPGGLFYACYYTRPGGTRYEALFRIFQDILSKEEDGPLEQRSARVLEKLESLCEEQAPLFRAFPLLEHLIADVKQRDPRYVMHEYCNKFFIPWYFSDIASDLNKLGMSYVGSTELERNESRNLLKPEHHSLLDGLVGQEAEIRASLLSHESFRWDVFRRATGTEDDARQADADGQFYVDSIFYPYNYPAKADVEYRPVSFDTDEFRALIALAHTGQRTIEGLVNHPDLSSFDPAQIRQTLRDMIAAHLFRPTTRPAGSTEFDRKGRFTLDEPVFRVLWDRDFAHEAEAYLPSKLTGGALKTTGFSAFVCRELDGRTLGEAIERTSASIDGLSKKRRAHLGFPEETTPEQRAKEIDRFTTVALPMLIRSGVVGVA